MLLKNWILTQAVIYHKILNSGSTLSNDLFAGQRFHYQCSNPPFGMSWAKDASGSIRA